ncbi:cupin domain-containing protein [Gallaecimonas mangrovi]|uniref:cupin domain-containing protein n=1 Tax=Gallaecimonas mangrovi TaxID=2291597 RepID=UPI000E202BF4|nr:cupin domain-containing protein [Gallaecimonas mangrovi]
MFVPLNMDFSKAVTIDTNSADWIPSPKAGVWRCPLERELPEQGHTTSLVRYEPGAAFSQHQHPKGEEILVLDGVFCDDSGEYKAGSYLRHPAGSKHAPYSAQGCTLLVKLNQFQTGDNRRIAVDTRPWCCEPGLPVELPLHRFGNEYTALIRLPHGADTFLPCLDGQVEALVLKGTLLDARGRYRAGTWLRRADWFSNKLMTAEDTVLFIKQGHFPTST